MSARTVDTVIVGAGHAGLAVSWHLQARGLDHVVLDRGRVAERWRTERWDSLRTLTPNWMSRLPGFAYDGAEPDGFMTVPALVAYFERYAEAFGAPIEAGVRVDSVRRHGRLFEVVAGRRRWIARNVVLATGWADRPAIPAIHRHVPASVAQLSSARYRGPHQVSGQRVLIVGASASGVQIAAELAAAGRHITLAVGRHRRLPRRYRGRDIMAWLDRSGILDHAPRDEAERRRLTAEPSVQLSGHGPLDLARLQQSGVTLAGRLVRATDDRAWFADDLAASVDDAEARRLRMLRRIDELADGLGIAAVDDDPVWPVDCSHAPGHARLGHRGGIDTVIWATGFRRSYPWLHVPVLDAAGEVRHERGLTPLPGLFTVGMRFQSGRRSTFIDGARLDAPIVADAIARRARGRDGTVAFAS